MLNPVFSKRPVSFLALRLVLVLSFFAAKAAVAETPAFRLSRLFSDGMVLQRDTALPVHGTAGPGEQVTVSLDGRTAMATADSAGQWKAVLPAHPAGGPFVLEAVCGDRQIVLRDVCVGDVWLCSGQSNMQYIFKNAPHLMEKQEQIRDPRVRFFGVQAEMSETPCEEPNLSSPPEKSSWKAADAGNFGWLSAVGYLFGARMASELKVPVGVIFAARGDTPIEAWLPEPVLREAEPSYQVTKPEYYRGSIFYNSMIAPLTRFPVRGVAWYQGENNSSRPENYAALLEKLVGSWREAWARPDMPFVIVQLASYGGAPWDGSRTAWSYLREAQSEVRKRLSGVDVVPSYDVGEYEDIHPADKEPVAHRLAEAAKSLLDGSPSPVPRFARSQPDGRTLILEFSGAQSLQALPVAMNRKKGLRPGADPEAFHLQAGELAGFEVADESGSYHPAKATIRGASVALESEAVENPRHARYAWGNFVLANLANEKGVPVEPFRTDSLPLPEFLRQPVFGVPLSASPPRADAQDGILNFQSAITELVPEEHEGREGWRAKSRQKGGQPVISLRAPEALRNQPEPLACTVTVVYYDDTPRAVLRLQYDSFDQGFPAESLPPGASKPARAIRLEGKGGWKAASLEIPDARFAGRLWGQDLSIVSLNGAPVCLASVSISPSGH